MRGENTRGGRRGPRSGLQAQCAGVAPLTAGVADALITAEAEGAAGTRRGEDRGTGEDEGKGTLPWSTSAL